MSGLPTRTRHYQNAVMNSAKWDSFIPRPDDIIITTSYKAGTTWLQGICAALVFQQPQPPVAQDELSPWFDSNFAPLDIVVDQIAGLQNRRYIKTHCPLDGIKFFDEAKYIFVGRDAGGNKKRAVIKFDLAVSGIPAGSVITNVILQLHHDT